MTDENKEKSAYARSEPYEWQNSVIKQFTVECKNAKCQYTWIGEACAASGYYVVLHEDCYCPKCGSTVNHGRFMSEIGREASEEERARFRIGKAHRGEKE